MRELGVGREDEIERPVAEEFLDMLLGRLPVAGVAGVDQHRLFAAAHDVGGEMPVRQLALILDAETAAGPQQVRRDDARQFARRPLPLPLGHASSPRLRPPFAFLFVGQIAEGA